MADLALVVDDDVASFELFTYTLNQLNFKVKGVTTAEDAIVEMTRDLPALVLLDIKLPGQDGTAVIDWLLKNGKIDAVRLIIVTAGGVTERLEKYDRNFEVIIKPITRYILRNQIQT